jgi:hypothetical protein
VTSAERIDLARGDACTITVKLETFLVTTRPTEDQARARELHIRCRDIDVFRQTTVKDWDTTVHELPGERPGTFRQDLKYWAGGDPEVHIDSDEATASVVAGGATAFRVELSVDQLGSESQRALFASSEKRAPGLRPSREHRGKVTRASSKSPARAGAGCTIREQADWIDGKDNCRLRVFCADTLVYRGSAACPEQGPIRWLDLKSSAEDGNPRLELDLDAGSAALSESGDSQWSLSITLGDDATP